MEDSVLDRMLIRELVVNWVVWRDANQWEKFRTVWHDDGRMMATWTHLHLSSWIRICLRHFLKAIGILPICKPGLVKRSKQMRRA